MALRMTYEKFGINFDDAYWRATWAGGNKHTVKVVIDIWASEAQANPMSTGVELVKERDEEGNILSVTEVETIEPNTGRNPNQPLDTKTFEFSHTDAGAAIKASTSLIQAAYLALKSLPDFNNAEDV